MKRVMILAVFFALTNALLAQPSNNAGGNDKSEKIQALLRMYISERLNLTVPEAEKFWPVFNQYQNDVRTLRQNLKTEDGAKPTADQQLDFEQKKLDLKKRYKGQFEGCLGKEKVNTLFGLEKEFHDKVKEMREHRQQMKGNGPGSGRGAQGGYKPNGGPR